MPNSVGGSCGGNDGFMKHADKQLHLQRLLNDLNRHYGAMSHFGRSLGSVVGRKLHRNFAHRILKGEIKFERGLHPYIDDAIKLANELLERYGQRQRSRLKKVDLQHIIDSRAKAEQLFEQIREIEQLAESGAYAAAFRQIQGLERVIDLERLQQVSSYHAERFQAIYTKIKQRLKRQQDTYTSHSIPAKTMGEVEQFVRTGQLTAAKPFITTFRDVHHLSLLQTPQRIISLRIVAEYFLRSGDLKQGTSYWRTAYELADREELYLELELLEQIRAQFLWQ